MREVGQSSSGEAPESVADAAAEVADEAACAQEVVEQLLAAKGGAQATQSVQVAINSSVIQLAKTHLQLVISSICAFLQGRASSDLHELWLLRLLCQVLETCSSGDPDVASDGGRRAEEPCLTVEASVALELAQHLVAQAARLAQDDPRQQAISDVLVALAPMHPDVVVAGLLAAVDERRAGAPAAGPAMPPSLVRILTEIAHTTPRALRGRLNDVMSRYLSLLQLAKSMEMKLLLCRACSSISVALVSCLVGATSRPFAVNDSTFSRAFPAAALRARGAQADAGRGPARPDDGEPEDRRKAMQSLSAAFTILLRTWQGAKDTSVKIGSMEAVGHLCLVIPKDLFLSNSDAVLEMLVSLLSRQVSNAQGPTHVKLMRGFCLLLQVCIDTDPEMLLLESSLQTVTSTLFMWVVGAGPLQCLQGSKSTEVIQSHAETMRCFEVLCAAFPKQVLGFLLQRLKSGREEKLGALLILRSVVGCSTVRPRPATIVQGILHLTGDSDLAVGLLLGELIVALAAGEYLVAEAGSEDAPKPEHVQALLYFLVGQTALTLPAEGEQSSFAKFTRSQPVGGPSCQEVRSSAGLVLGQLAGGLRPSVRAVLWPMLLQALVEPSMRPGLPSICRAVSQIVASVRDAGAPGTEMEELAAGVRASPTGAGAERMSPTRSSASDKSQPPAPHHSLFISLLLCAHSPHDPPGVGASIVRCLEYLGPLIHPMLGEIWEAPSTRLHALVSYLEDPGAACRAADVWPSALAQEVRFFLSALPDHDDLPSRLVEILTGMHAECWRRDRDASESADVQRAAVMNLMGVCLGQVSQRERVTPTLDLLLSGAEHLTEAAVRGAFARSLGTVAERHFDLVLTALGRAAKADAASKRTGSLAQSLFGKSSAAQQAECLRAMLALALGYCAAYAPSREALRDQVCEHILGPLAQSLTQERTVLVLRSVIDAIRLASDSLRTPQGSAQMRDPFLVPSRPPDEEDAVEAAFAEDEDWRAAVCQQRDALVKALIPFSQPSAEEPQAQDDPKPAELEELVCPALGAIGSLIALPVDLQSNLYATVLEGSLMVLVTSIPADQPRPSSEKQLPEALHSRIEAVTGVVQSLLFHSHSWLAVSRLLQAVHTAGARGHAEFVRWVCTRLIGVLCRAAPIVRVPDDGEEEDEEAVPTDIGDWCESLSLLLPRTGDSCKAVVAVAIEAVQQLLARCEWTAGVAFCQAEPPPLLPSDDARGAGARRPRRCAAAVSAPAPSPLLREEGDPSPPSQQLVAILVSKLPPLAIPPLLQHLMPAMHDADSHAALSGADALYLILQACCEKLSSERAANLVGTVFEEIERVSHSSVRQKILSCIRVLATHHFDCTINELLERGPDSGLSTMGALQVLARDKALLLRLFNHFTDTLNNSDPGSTAQPNKLVLAATVALGHLFTVSDSSVGVVVRKYFPQLFGTFLLRIGTTPEGLHAQQAAAAFMNFLHASQNDSMALALEGDRLSRADAEQSDELVGELAALFCRHHPSKREHLLSFILPFVGRPVPGHRLAAATTACTVLLSGTEAPLPDALVAGIAENALRCAEDAPAPVRRQSVRALGHLFALWGDGRAGDPAAGERSRSALPAVLRALGDASPPVQRAAVVALQRACQVEAAGADWLRQLLGGAGHLWPLLDSEDVALRSASLDLLATLCGIWMQTDTATEPEEAGPGDGASGAFVSPGEVRGAAADDGAGGALQWCVAAPEAVSGEAQALLQEARAEFARALDILLIHCTVRLADPAPGVASTASRCLQQLVLAASRGRGGDSHSGLEGAPEEAAELLQRMEQEGMAFEQFVFPFIALVHRPRDVALAARRLELCRAYLAADAAEAAPGRVPVAMAAGCVAAALARTLCEVRPRPSALLCGLCRDLMRFLAAEDPDARAQVARILGFFDILAC